jgi:hypothetical protein
LTIANATRYIHGMITETELDPALERGRLRVVIATIIINIVVVSLLTFAPWSDWHGRSAQHY